MTPAERMRLHRQRRREGMTCLWVELRAPEIQELVSRGFLSATDRGDRTAITQGLYRLLEHLVSNDA